MYTHLIVIIWWRERQAAWLSFCEKLKTRCSFVRLNIILAAIFLDKILHAAYMCSIYVTYERKSSEMFLTSHNPDSWVCFSSSVWVFAYWAPIIITYDFCMRHNSQIHTKCILFVSIATLEKKILPRCFLRDFTVFNIADVVMLSHYHSTSPGYSSNFCYFSLRCDRGIDVFVEQISHNLCSQQGWEDEFSQSSQLFCVVSLKWLNSAPVQLICPWRKYFICQQQQKFEIYNR